METVMQNSLLISVCALVFTIVSFWWMNWRPGKLEVTTPRSFALGRAAGREVLFVRIPMVFINSGARPLLVQNLRLIIQSIEEQDRPFEFNSVATSLDFNAPTTLATQFPLKSREALLQFGDFVRRPGTTVFHAGSHTAEIHILLGQSTAWRLWTQFQLIIPKDSVAEANTADYIAFDNYGEMIGIPGR
jgi:hypothetical protein